jgi:hypothetical protein
MKKQNSKTFLCGVIFTISLLFSSCYSVFNGGTGGMVVDAESTSSPKRGIANVDIYAYTNKDIRNSDFSNWQEGTTFSPSNTYYGHTTTDADGSFVISNIVWTESYPDFGKDADYTTIYLLFYHENFGLTKGQTVITSDSTSNTVYQELTSVRKTTALNINIYDVSDMNQTANDVLVEVSVPQNTDTITAPAKVYRQTIAGTGTINISYPRWKNAEDKANNIENTPQVTITYTQSADEITWKACANADNEAHNYAFLEDNFQIRKTIRNDTYRVSLYGKATRLRVPTVNGTYGDKTDPANDERTIKMMAKDSSGSFSIDCGEAYTQAQTVGTSSTQTHGYFNGLGNGATWTDTSYTGKYTTIDVKFFVDGTEINTIKTLRSDTSPVTVKL